MSRARAAVAGLLAAVVLAGAAGCTSGSAGRGGAGQSFISGDGTVVLLPAARRAAPVQFAGATLEGDRFDLAGYRGKVVVANVWGSWCGPCRKEARELQAAWQRLQGSGVQFVGIDTQDQSAQALAFQRTFGITYPSVADDGGKVLLPLRGAVAPNAIPTTVVIDAQSRVAARVSGPTTTDTLVALVEDVLAGRTSASTTGGSG